MPPQDRGQIDLRARALHQADQNQPSAMRQRFEILTQVGRADTVENDVGAASVSRGS